MTKEQFDDFIAENKLYNFDGLIRITLKNEQEYDAVWITTLPKLDKSVDGKFGGMPEKEVFFLFNKNEYIVLSPNEIGSINCMQSQYLC